MIEPLFDLWMRACIQLFFYPNLLVFHMRPPENLE